MHWVRLPKYGKRNHHKIFLAVFPQICFGEKHTVTTLGTKGFSVKTDHLQEKKLSSTNFLMKSRNENNGKSVLSRFFPEAEYLIFRVNLGEHTDKLEWTGGAVVFIQCSSHHPLLPATFLSASPALLCPVLGHSLGEGTEYLPAMPPTVQVAVGHFAPLSEAALVPGTVAQTPRREPAQQECDDWHT